MARWAVSSTTLRCCVLLAASIGLTGCDKAGSPQQSLVAGPEATDAIPQLATPVRSQPPHIPAPATPNPAFDTATGFSGDYDPYKQQGGTPPPKQNDAPDWPEPSREAIVELGEAPGS